MFLYRSNRMERLLSELAALVKQPLSDALAAESIVVQSPGMARYLSMGLAKAHGIWANPDFLFPRGLVQRVCDAVLGPCAQEALTTSNMMWTLVHELDKRCDDPRLADFGRYVQADTRGDRLLQLATRLAALFDDYLIYRDDILQAWEQGTSPNDPQAELWRSIVARFGTDHIATRTRSLCEALQKDASVEQLPERLSVFGLSTLPPPYLRVLTALSERIPVHVFVLSPCQEYWVELSSRQRTQRKSTQSRRSAQELHFEEGHRLLASLGTTGREFLQLLESHNEPKHGDFDCYQDIEPDCMLRALQSDILHLCARPMDAPLLTLSELDRSIEVHICHSPMREVEVLHDQLLRLFDEEGLRPEDVVVMAPDIERYAPLVSTVFGKDSGRPAIPYRLADRSNQLLDPLVGALDATLTLLRGRMPISGVLDLLARPAIAARFGMGEPELAEVRRWASQSGMRWGVDANHRQAEGQPRDDANTLLFGLQRLLLGLAMDGDNLSTFAERLPYNDVESGDLQLLGRFSTYLRTLFALHALSEDPITPQAFASLARQIIRELFPGSGEPSISAKRTLEALNAFERDTNTCEVARALSWSSLQNSLLSYVVGDATSRGFLSGGVTFCQVVPMRSVPSPAIFLLGMDDGAFPRRDRPLSFDRRQQDRRLGDRRLRDDDRFLFLETMISARSKLVISYVGRGIQDNKVRPPSTLVSELIESLERTYGDASQIRSHICVEHPLSATSSAYFHPNPDDRLFSYATHLLAGAQARTRENSPRPFLDFIPQTSASSAPASSFEMSLSDLERWVADPIRMYFQNRLGLQLEEDAEALLDREPMTSSALDRYSLGDTILKYRQRDHAQEQIERALIAQGKLPLGVPGQLAFKETCEMVESILRLAEQSHADAHSSHLQVDLTLDGAHITGAIRGVYPQRYIHTQFNKLGRASELRAWVRHLALNWQATHHQLPISPRTTRLVGRVDAEVIGFVEFVPVTSPDSLLTECIQFARRAVERPQPFVFEVAKALLAKRRPGTKSPWHFATEAFYRAQEYSAYLRLTYPKFADFRSAEGGAFERYATLIVEPMLAARGSNK